MKDSTINVGLHYTKLFFHLLTLMNKILFTIELLRDSN